MLLALTGVVALCYWAGLSGPFLIDDHQNLGQLALKGLGIQSFGDWLQFVFGGEAGPLGRPLSLASFTLNAQTWPADPWPFKLTNLLLHLSNGALVFFLARRIYTIAGVSNAHWCACLCAGFWMLHPIQVSTVLYVVQRMTELTTLFTLTGIYAYIHGRTLVAASPTQAYAWMIAGIAGGGALATLSKENGALLPLFALTLECTVLRTLPQPPAWQHVRAFLLRVPVLALIAYLAWTAPHWLDSYFLRPYSPLERLGTQGLVLLDYLYRIFIPRLSGSGLFFDHYRIVENAVLLAVCWSGVVGLIICAILARTRHAIAAAAVLWFFAGHVLESTILNLELYFEHRNYLPLFGPALAVGLLLAHTARINIAAAVAIIAPLALLTCAQARVWGDELRAAAVWPRENPDSARAHQVAIIAMQTHGKFDEALELMRGFAARYQNDPTTRVMLMEVTCPYSIPIESYATDTVPLLREGRFTFGLAGSLKHLAQLKQLGACSDLKNETLLRMLQATKDNVTVQALPDQLAFLAYVEASVLAAGGNFRAAIATVEPGVTDTTSINLSYWQTIWALELGDIDSAKRYLSRAHRFEREKRIGFYTPDPFLSRLDELVQRGVDVDDG